MGPYPLLLRPHCTRLYTLSHSYSVHLPNARFNYYIILFSGKLWNALLAFVFLPAFDFSNFNREVLRTLSSNLDSHFDYTLFRGWHLPWTFFSYSCLLPIIRLPSYIKENMYQLPPANIYVPTYLKIILKQDEAHKLYSIYIKNINNNNLPTTTAPNMQMIFKCV